MAITTLGATSEGQKVDGLQDEEARRFMLHYNFPPFSTGEVRPMRGPGRREIGHGALAEEHWNILSHLNRNFLMQYGLFLKFLNLMAHRRWRPFVEEVFH